MTIYQFFESKEISIKEIESNFTLEKTLDVDAVSQGKPPCLNCGDTLNVYSYPSESWTAVRRCTKCKRINAIIFSDRMGGTYTDTVLIFKEKDDNSN